MIDTRDLRLDANQAMQPAHDDAGELLLGCNICIAGGPSPAPSAIAIGGATVYAVATIPQRRAA